MHRARRVNTWVLWVSWVLHVWGSRNTGDRGGASAPIRCRACKFMNALRTGVLGLFAALPRRRQLTVRTACRSHACSSALDWKFSGQASSLLICKVDLDAASATTKAGLHCRLQLRRLVHAALPSCTAAVCLCASTRGQHP